MSNSSTSLSLCPTPTNCTMGPNKEETEETLSLAKYKSLDQVPPIKVLYNQYDFINSWSLDIR